MTLGIEVLSVAGFRACFSSLLYSSPKVGTRDRWIDDADRQAGGRGAGSGSGARWLEEERNGGGEYQ